MNLLGVEIAVDLYWSGGEKEKKKRRSLAGQRMQRRTRGEGGGGEGRSAAVPKGRGRMQNFGPPSEARYASKRTVGSTGGLP